jgi:hypothetical protein
MQRPMVRQLMNDELKRVWKEAAVAYFKVIILALTWKD